MKKAISLFVAMTLLLTSCGSEIGSSSDSQFKTLYSAEVETLNYLNSKSEIEFSIVANVIDTLVEYDQYGNIQPCLATGWSVSSDGLTWTLDIREGVKWVNNKGEESGYEVTAHDFVTSAKWHLNPENASVNEFFLDGVIKNANAYFNGEVSEFSEVGVKALDNYSVRFEFVIIKME